MPIRPCPTAWPSRPTSWQIRSKSSKYVVDTLFTYLMAFRYAPTRPCASRLHTLGYTMLDLWHACKLIAKTKQTNKNRCSRDPNDIRLDIPTQGHFHGFILPVRWHAIIHDRLAMLALSSAVSPPPWRYPSSARYVREQNTFSDVFLSPPQLAYWHNTLYNSPATDLYDVVCVFTSNRFTVAIFTAPIT